MNYKYFDNAATTRVSDEVLQAYNEACKDFYNPSSLYTPSLMVKNKIEMARENILRALGGANKSTFILQGVLPKATTRCLKIVSSARTKSILYRRVNIHQPTTRQKRLSMRDIILILRHLMTMEV